jgi:hypothetical protein
MPDRVNGQMTLLRKIESISLIIISAASIGIAGIDYFGFFEKIAVLHSLNYVSMLFVLLSLVGLHLGATHLERVAFHDKFSGGIDAVLNSVEVSTEGLIKSVHGVKVTSFGDAGDQELYLARRIREAKVEVCDLSWKEKLSRHYSLNRRQKTHKSYESSIAKACQNVSYREIFVLSDERRKEKLKRRIEENHPGYSCRYYDVSSNIPRLQFVIIDKEEIVFASSSYPTLCAIKHKELGEIFQSYYDDLWDHAIPLKEGDTVFAAELRKALDARLVAH